MNWNPYFDQAKKAFDEEKWEEVVAASSDAIDFDAQCYPAYLLRGLAYARIGQHKEAIKDFTRFLNLIREVPITDDDRKDYDSYVAFAYFNRAIAYLNLGMYREVVDDISTLLGIDKSYPEARMLRASAFYELGLYDHALRDLNQEISLSRNPDSSYRATYFLRGNVHLRLGRLEDALNDFNFVLEQVVNEQVLIARAEVFFEMQRYDECLADAQRALKYSTIEPIPYYLIGRVHELRGNRTEALRYYDQAIRNGHELSRKYATQLRQVMLSDREIVRDIAEITLPNIEMLLDVTKVVQQQAQLATSYEQLVVQYINGVERLQQHVAESKQAIESEMREHRQDLGKVASLIMSFRRMVEERKSTLLPKYVEPPKLVDKNIEDFDLDTLKTYHDQAEKALEELKDRKESPTGCLTMIAVPIALVVGIFIAQSLQITIFMLFIFGIVILVVRKVWYDSIREKLNFVFDRIHKMETWVETRRSTLERESQEKMNELEQQHEQKMTKHSEDSGAEMGKWAHVAMDFLKKTKDLAPAWDDDSWNEWQPTTTSASLVRVGRLHSWFADGQFCIPIPIFINFPGKRALLYKVPGQHKHTAIASIQSVILRLLTITPPGRALFTFIDPVGLGQNVAAFMSLMDYNKELVTGKAWSEPRHIDEQLTDLTEYMENVIQKYLRNRYDTIEEYNVQAGEIAEPYRILVVFDFPVNFQNDASRRLLSIAQQGARCGIFAIILTDMDQPQPYGFDMAALERTSSIIAWHPEREQFVLVNEQGEEIQVELEPMPDSKLVSRILEKVGEASLRANKVEVPFYRIAPPPDRWWSENSAELFQVPLGLSGTRNIQYLTLRQGGASPHALLVGQPGSGKSTLLHALVVGAALNYSPDEVQLYLIDFKEGVEFKPYAVYQLPHAKVIAIRSEREFGLSVLEGLHDEYKRRGTIFRDSHVASLAAYRNRTGYVLPRILLIVDEFHKFFIEEDQIAFRARQLLEILVREGRGMGIHVILSSQNLTGAASLPDSIKSAFGIRIALRCREEDSRLILADDNPAARLLSRPGEAIYNDANGRVEGNNPFQVAFLSDDDRDSYLKQIRAYAQQYQIQQFVFDGNQPADIRNNAKLWQSFDAQVDQNYPYCLWLGEPVSISDHVSVSLKRQSGMNLLIVGKDEQAGQGVMTSILISLAAQLLSGRGQQVAGARTFSILDFSADDGSNYLYRLAELLPHPVARGGRRQMIGMLKVLAQEVYRRVEGNLVREPPIFLFIYGLQWARDLRQDASGSNFTSGRTDGFDTSVSLSASLDQDNFGMSNSFESMFGGTSHALQTPSDNPSNQLTLILREGPDVGVHTIIWCDTMSNLYRTFDLSTLREFVLRVAFQMSEGDSQSLIASSAANKIGDHRALLYNDDTGEQKKFRPYALNEQVLQEYVLPRIKKKSNVCG